MVMATTASSWLWLSLTISALLPCAQALTQQYFTNRVNERAVACPGDPRLIGYKHMIDINVDQRSELERISKGKPERRPYIFPLCNRFKFLMKEEVLQVLLDNITFVCGYNGTNKELCVLEGGDLQVNIPEAVENTTVSFRGLSFFNFTGISTKAYGGASSKITFDDVKWKYFKHSATAVHQMNPQGGEPMQMEINKGVFEDGTGGNLIDNVGGKLSYTDLNIVENVKADSVIRTSEKGTSSLTTAQSTESDLVKLTHTLGGSSQSVTGVDIFGMFSMGSIFFVEGAGSSMEVSNVVVQDNKLKEGYHDQTARNFNVFIATGPSTATLQNFTITNNDGMDRVFSASDGAQVSVINATVTECKGTSPPDLLSNVAMAEDGSSMNIKQLFVSDLTAFSSIYFAICGSYIQAFQSCVINGRVAAPAFISADSDFASDGNYIDTAEVTADRCRNDRSASVYQESSVENACFSETGTGECDGTCVAGFTESAECLYNSTNTTYTLNPVPAAGSSAANPSCPASPPTPAPTLPPVVAVGVGAAAAGPGGATPPPIFTNTIPPGNVPPGAPGGPGSSPGGSPGSSPGSSGASGGDGSGGDGNSVPAAAPRLVQFGCSFLIAQVLHGLIFELFL